MWDLSKVEVSTGYSPLPPGDYLVVAKAGELKATKSGSGEYVNVEFTIIGEKFNQRKLFHRFNTKNENPTAVKIGKELMAQFFLAAGLKSEQLSAVTPDDFAGQSCLANVIVETSTYGEQNVIKSFKPFSETQPLPVTAKGTTAVKPKMKATF